MGQGPRAENLVISVVTLLCREILCPGQRFTC